MSIYRYITATALLLLAVSGGQAFAAGSAEGAPDDRAYLTGFGPELKQSARLMAPKMKAAVVELPETTALQDDEHPPGTDQPANMQVGYVLDAPDDLVASVPWGKTAEGGLARRIELHSEGAVGLRLALQGHLPDGVELRVYGKGGAVTYGPYDYLPGFQEQGGPSVWWTPTVFDSTVGLEFYVKPGHEAPSALPQISQISYLYRFAHPVVGPGLLDGGTDPLDCHNDVTCSAGWADEAAGVIHMHYIVNGGNFICTGALLNRNPDDGSYRSPIFMTARHCLSTQSSASTLETYYFWQTSVCNGSPPDYNDPVAVPRRTGGALLLHTYADADWCLMGLRDRPPGGVYYQGWDSDSSWSTLVAPESATGIHHPRGSYKRISFGDSKGRNTVKRTFSNGVEIEIPAYGLWRIDYTSGTVEKGSSGSPIFDSSGKVRGTLTGGDLGCPETTVWYGRLSEAYDLLKPYMYDMPSPVFVDISNNGTQTGSSGNPYNEVEEGTFAVRTGDEVHIASGNYNEQITLWRPVTLRRWGDSGIVRIGD